MAKCVRCNRNEDELAVGNNLTKSDLGILCDQCFKTKKAVMKMPTKALEDKVRYVLMHPPALLKDRYAMVDDFEVLVARFYNQF
jgi:hypothetical protein